jgi:hypothetical protein
MRAGNPKSALKSIFATLPSIGRVICASVLKANWHWLTTIHFPTIRKKQSFKLELGFNSVNGIELAVVAVGGQ